MAPHPNPDQLQRERARILGEVMRSHRRRLWWQARRFTASEHDADDAVEDACVAFLRFFLPESGGSPLGWMMTATRFRALALARRSQVRHVRDAAPRASSEFDEWWASFVGDPGASTEETVEGREWADMRAELFAELRPDQRTALALVAFGFTYAEIADRQGWSPRKVRRSLETGRVRLRELLAARGENT
jgi:RNA polymerase sigma factor (sigma-70 family)